MSSRNSICECGSGKRFKHCHGKYLTSTGSTIFPFSAKFDQLSLSSCYLELYANGHLIGNATGFLWRHADDISLVTNWHVVAGKDILTNQQLDGPTCPDKIRVFASVRSEADLNTKESIVENAVGAVQQSMEVCVYTDFDFPLWLQHVDWATKRIDVVLLKIAQNYSREAKKNIICINDYKFGQLLHLTGSEIFVIGYPIREEIDSYLLPIWKNGTIAREPFAGWKNRPALLVDSRTSKGMSGSPVVRRVFGPATDKDISTDLRAVVTSEFLGIYSSRLIDGDKLPSIGIVWWRSVIDEILAQPITGKRFIEPEIIAR